MKTAKVNPRAAILIAALMASATANAGLVLEQKPVEKPASDAAKAPLVKRVPLDLSIRKFSNIDLRGVPPTQLPLVKGMGTNVTFMNALRQIVPEGWKVYTEGAVDMDADIDWSGNRTWPQILNSILVTVGDQATMNWDLKEITITPLPPKPAAVAAKEKAAEPKAPPVPVWKMTYGPTIKPNLEAWAKSIGWTVEWNARSGNEVYDYPSDVFKDVELKGELMGTKGVFARVIAAFVDSEPPLAVEFFRENKRVEVTIYRRNSVRQLGGELPAAARSAAQGQ